MTKTKNKKKRQKNNETRKIGQNRHAIDFGLLNIDFQWTNE